jgi:hypothetical protein
MNNNVNLSLTKDRSTIVNIFGLDVLSNQKKIVDICENSRKSETCENILGLDASSKQWRNIHILGNKPSVKKSFENSNIDLQMTSINTKKNN